jgi:transcriptional regulator with XRE-family HTH domain
MTQPGCFEALQFLIKRIKQSANRAGIHTVRDMALASGVSRSGIDKIYRLKSYPTFDTLLAMAAACGANVSDWVEGLAQLPESKGQRPERKPKQQDGQQDKPKRKPSKAKQSRSSSSKSDNSSKSDKKADLMAMLNGMKPE